MTQYHEIRASNLSIRNESWSAKRLQPRLCFDFPSAASAHLNFFPERNVCLSSRSCSSKPRMVTCALIDRRVQLIDCCQAHTADSYVLQEKVSIYQPLYLWCLIIAESVKTFCRVPLQISSTAWRSYGPELPATLSRLSESTGSLPLYRLPLLTTRWCWERIKNEDFNVVLEVCTQVGWHDGKMIAADVYAAWIIMSICFHRGDGEKKLPFLLAAECNTHYTRSQIPLLTVQPNFLIIT